MFCGMCGREIAEGTLCDACRGAAVPNAAFAPAQNIPVTGQQSADKAEAATDTAELSTPVLTRPVLTKPQLTEYTFADYTEDGFNNVGGFSASAPAASDFSTSVDSNVHPPFEHAAPAAAQAVPSAAPYSAPQHAVPSRPAYTQAPPAYAAPAYGAPAAPGEQAPVYAQPVQGASGVQEEKVSFKKLIGIVLAVFFGMVFLSGMALCNERMDANTRAVRETMERFCTSIEEMDVYGMLNCMYTDDLMDAVGEYLSESDMFFEDVQSMVFDELADAMEDGEWESVDLDYSIINSPREVEGEEFEHVANTLGLFLVTDVEKMLYSDIEIRVSTNEGDESGVEGMYFYKVEDKWYMIPRESVRDINSLLG